jgi:hypothetical protein
MVREQAGGFAKGVRNNRSSPALRLAGGDYLPLLCRLYIGIVVGVRVAIQVSLGDVHMGLIACREPGGHQRMP